jgi:D-xylose transport system permease protein
MSDMIEQNTDPSPTPQANKPTAQSAVEVPSYTPRRTIGQLLRSDLGFLPVLVTLLLIVVFFTIVSNGVFLSPENFTNLALQIATIGVVGLGLILVLLIGEIDLSAAAVSTFCSVVMAILSERMGVPAIWAILIALLAGGLVGAINGFFVAVLRIPSFIVTLAASIGYSGLLLTLLNGQSTLIIHDSFIDGIAGSPTSFLTDILGVGLPTLAVLLYVASQISNYFSRKKAGLRALPLSTLIIRCVISVALVEGVVILFENNSGVPYSTAILFGLIIIFWLIMTKTGFGRHVYAVGGNAEAARRAGINVVTIRIIIFALCSMLAAAGGIIDASRGLAVASQVSPSLLLDAIGAAVIGGVSLFGGRGSVWAIVLGVLIIGSLENGLALKSQGADIKQIVEGLVLLLAVTSDALIRRLQARSHSGR